MSGALKSNGLSKLESKLEVRKSFIDTLLASLQEAGFAKTADSFAAELKTKSNEIDVVKDKVLGLALENRNLEVNSKKSGKDLENHGSLFGKSGTQSPNDGNLTKKQNSSERSSECSGSRSSTCSSKSSGTKKVSSSSSSSSSSSESSASSSDGSSTSSLPSESMKNVKQNRRTGETDERKESGKASVQRRSSSSSSGSSDSNVSGSSSSSSRAEKSSTTDNNSSQSSHSTSSSSSSESENSERPKASNREVSGSHRSNLNGHQNVTGLNDKKVQGESSSSSSASSSSSSSNSSEGAEKSSSSSSSSNSDSSSSASAASCQIDKKQTEKTAADLPQRKPAAPVEGGRKMIKTSFSSSLDSGKDGATTERKDAPGSTKSNNESSSSSSSSRSAEAKQGVPLTEKGSSLKSGGSSSDSSNSSSSNSSSGSGSSSSSSSSASSSSSSSSNSSSNSSASSSTNEDSNESSESSSSVTEAKSSEGNGDCRKGLGTNGMKANPRSESVVNGSGWKPREAKVENLSVGKSPVSTRPVSKDSESFLSERKPVVGKTELKKRRRSDADLKREAPTPFKRVKEDKVVYRDDRLRDNRFETKSDTYGAKAHQDLVSTRGKGFRKEKTKKKRQNHHGGTINYAVQSIKFEDSD